jgi:Uma2 family endonuclease
MSASPLPSSTLEKYLDQQEQADYKSEFFNGMICAMSGGTPNHSQLSARMLALLDRALPHCRVFDSNLKLYIEQFNQAVCPDCMAACNDLQFVKNRSDIILNPTLVVEVLSPSTKAHDQSTKTHCYHSVLSIQHILLVSQDHILADQYARTSDRTWTLTRYSSRKDTVLLLDIGISLEEIYRNIP